MKLSSFLIRNGFTKLDAMRAIYQWKIEIIRAGEDVRSKVTEDIEIGYGDKIRISRNGGISLLHYKFIPAGRKARSANKPIQARWILLGVFGGYVLSKLLFNVYPGPQRRSEDLARKSPVTAESVLQEQQARAQSIQLKAKQDEREAGSDEQRAMLQRAQEEAKRLKEQERSREERQKRDKEPPVKEEASTLSFDERLATCFDTDLILSGVFATDHRSDITFSEFKNRAQYQLLGRRTESYKHIHSDGKIYEMTSIDGGEPSNCSKTADLDQVVDSCTPESPGGICKGIHYRQGNTLVQLSCTPSGPISEDNPACQKRIVGYLFR